MKYSQPKLILALFALSILSSCAKKDEPVEFSIDPTFVSLTFAKNDKSPLIENTIFTLENGTLIVNPDSLPYNTRIDSIYASFSFRSTSGMILYLQNEDSIRFTGKDTLDLTQLVKIRNISQDLEHDQLYDIKVNVHQVEPELYVWNKRADNMQSIDAVHQKAVFFRDSLYYFVNNNTQSTVYLSGDGSAWKPETTVNGLPTYVSFNDLTVLGNKFYVTANDNKIYSSDNGFSWSVKQLSNYVFRSLLFSLNNKLWAIVQSDTDTKRYFASSSDASSWEVYLQNEVPNNFPLSDFSSHTYKSRTGREKALILGGLDAQGNLLKTNWNSENGTYWIDFSLQNKNLDTLAIGSSIISYDDKLFVFGVRSDKSNVSHYRVSRDEGLSWQVPDSAYNTLPLDYIPRNHTSAIVFMPLKYDKTTNYSKAEIVKSNRIFLIGGATDTQQFSDVWTVKLNRKDFIKQ